jgi:tetratricopeptide (TPR) repeat protein
MAVVNWLTRVRECVAATWRFVSRGGLPGLVSVVLVIGIVEVARECLSDTILMEPVIVKGPVGGPTIEMATQQIATYFDKIQRTGAREWRPLAFSEGGQTISIQIPGTPFNVESIIREVASFFPHRRRTLKISITANPSGTGYAAAVSISRNGSLKRKTCETDNKPGELGTMFECIAVEAMEIIDPLYAASYALSVEGERCARFQPEHLPTTDRVSEKKRLLETLRDYCSFARTRSLVSTIIDRGRTDDQPWVTYIYGKLHLARADAVAKVDTEAQWYEFDRAIRRFEASQDKQNKLPPTARAIQMETYVKNGISIQESVGTLDWKTQGDFIRHRLNDAADILVKATGQLQLKHADSPPKVPTLCDGAGFDVNPALPVDEDPTAMGSHMRGLILYRQWMIQTRSRYRNGEFGFAEDANEETQLTKSLSYFETAACRQPKQPYEFYIEWGNTLRALRRFDVAVEKYRQAGDIAPDSSIPLLNVAVALLEKSKNSYRAQDEHRTEHLFEALRQTSSYLTWVSDGGPYTTFVDRIAEALGEVGDGSVAKDFASCRWNLSFQEADPKVADLSHTAALKYCVDRASDVVSGQVVDEVKARKANEAVEQQIAGQK